MGCGVVAHLTVSHPRFVRGQEERRRHVEAALDAEVTTIGTEAAALRVEVATTRGVLALSDPPERETLRRWVEQRLLAACEVLGNHERLVEAHDAVSSARHLFERRSARSLAADRATRLAPRLPQALRALRESAGALVACRSPRDATRDVAEPDTRDDHCVACGHSCTTGSRFCAGCGVATPETRTCRRCEMRLVLPKHLLAATDALPTTHCHACGERHAG